MSGAPLGSASGTFDANGNASASLGPAVYGARWNVDRIVVSTTSTAITQCDVYRNVVSATTKIDSTRTGNNDTSETNIDLNAPDVLLFVWTGGTAGASATAVLAGTLYTGRG